MVVLCAVGGVLAAFRLANWSGDAVNFLEPPDAFLAAVEGRVDRLDANEAAADALLGARGEPTVALFTPPLP